MLLTLQLELFLPMGLTGVNCGEEPYSSVCWTVVAVFEAAVADRLPNILKAVLYRLADFSLKLHERVSFSLSCLQVLFRLLKDLSIWFIECVGLGFLTASDEPVGSIASLILF